MTRLSARMPVALLPGMRIAARRPRRALLSMASVIVTGAGVVTVLMAHARFAARYPPAWSLALVIATPLAVGALVARTGVAGILRSEMA